MSVVQQIGRGFLGSIRDLGGMALLFWQVLAHIARGQCDRDAWFRAMRSYGEASLLIVAATAAFTGAIMVVQGAIYVRQFGVYNLVGWYTGFSTFREVGPVLVGLMFSGRVGANNTSELATMRVTEQLDAMRVLALDVHELLVTPRLLSMIAALTALVVFADAVAIGAGALCARLMLDLDYTLFFNSLLTTLRPADFLIGVGKAASFGLVIAVVSTHFGLTARGGSAGVGEAVNRQVVSSAVALFCMDYVITVLVPS